MEKRYKFGTDDVMLIFISLLSLFVVFMCIGMEV